MNGLACRGSKNGSERMPSASYVAAEVPRQAAPRRDPANAPMTGNVDVAPTLERIRPGGTPPHKDGGAFVARVACSLMRPAPTPPATVQTW